MTDAAPELQQAEVEALEVETQAEHARVEAIIHRNALDSAGSYLRSLYRIQQHPSIVRLLEEDEALRGHFDKLHELAADLVAVGKCMRDECDAEAARWAAKLARGACQ